MLIRPEIRSCIGFLIIQVYILILFIGTFLLIISFTKKSHNYDSLSLPHLIENIKKLCKIYPIELPMHRPPISMAVKAMSKRLRNVYECDYYLITQFYINP